VLSKPRFMVLFGFGVLVAMFVLLGAAPAFAGGSWLEPTHDTYAPGDTATLAGDVGPGQLGWLDDAPFFAWLRTTPPANAEDAQPPGESPGDIPLGRLNIHETGKSGYQALRVSISFTVPERLRTGRYEVVYCNSPCTTGLGDLIGGSMQVVSAPLVAAGDAVAEGSSHQPAFATRASETRPESSVTGFGIVMGASCVVVVGAVVGCVRVRRRRVIAHQRDLDAAHSLKSDEESRKTLSAV
jgi:hypothetical protein